MPAESRSPDNCPYRCDVQKTHDDETATCQLLYAITGVQSHSAAVVGRDACEACCQSFAPSEVDLNPIVASFLYELCDQIAQAGGVDGCDVAKAKKLNAWAERSLPAVAPDEDDCEDIAQRTYEHVESLDIQQLSHWLPIPPKNKPRRNRRLKWSVGVTTAPRRIPTLERCVDSIVKAGWPDPILFIDGDVDVPESLRRLDDCRRKPALGAFPNYMLSLSELYMRDPHADAYLIMQDDALMLPTPAVRDYLDEVLWFCEGPCIASLYCSTEYNQPNPGWHIFPDNWVWGAVAFVFSREALLQLIQSPAIWDHRAQSGDDGLSKIDVAIGQCASENRIPVYYPSPSLVQHIGTISTIWKVARAVNARRANRFIGDLVDPL